MISTIFSIRNFLYVLYALILTITLLYVRFPTEKFILFCENKIASFIPDSRCDIGSIKYSFPTTLGISSFEISKTTPEGGLSFQLKNINIEYQFKSTHFTLTGDLFAGKAEAELNINPKTKIFHFKNISLTGLNLSQIAQAGDITNRDITGEINITGDYQSHLDQPFSGTAKGTFCTQNGTFSLLNPVLSIATLDYTTITGNIIGNKKQYQITDGQFTGKDLNIEFAGNIDLEQPAADSSIHIKGQLTPSPVFMKKHPKQARAVRRLTQRYKMKTLPFKLGGTLQNPNFTFGI